MVHKRFFPETVKERLLPVTHNIANSRSIMVSLSIRLAHDKGFLIFILDLLASPEWYDGSSNKSIILGV